MSGDIAGAFIIASVTCSQTSPLTIVLPGEAGGHRGAITITQRSTAGNIDVAYLPDGVGGPQYLADHIPASGGDSRGFVTFNADGSGTVDVSVPFIAGSAGSFNGSSVKVKEIWTC